MSRAGPSPMVDVAKARLDLESEISEVSGVATILLIPVPCQSTPPSFHHANLRHSIASQHGPALMRLALHDALTWDDGSRSGGANASIAVPLELARPGNGGLQPALIVIEDIMGLHPGLTMADAIQLGGAVAVQALGGPHVPIRLGRRDIRVPPPSARLPTYDTCERVPSTDLPAMSGFGVGYCHPWAFQGGVRNPFPCSLRPMSVNVTAPPP